MNKTYHKIIHTLATGSLAFILGALINSANATTLNLAPNALELVTGVEPNVMVLSDDSGSMDWGMITSQSTGTYTNFSPLFGWQQLYTHSTSDDDLGQRAIPTQATLNGSSAFWIANGYTGWDGVWRVFNSTYNKVYYNPNTTYNPWKGVDNASNAYGNSVPTAARVDPFLSGSATLNLTTTLNYNSYMPHESLFMLYVFADSMFPARYYLWPDTNTATPANAGNGVVDSDDDRTLIEIRSSGCSAGATCPSSFTRPDFDKITGIGRSDCGAPTAGVVTCSVAQELQNFANWFTYYRRRELVAKAAIGNVIDPVGKARIGYATINNVSNNKIQVASMNASSSSGNKKTLLDNIYKTQSSGGTPLRQNLESVGLYFECKNGNIFGTGNTSPGNSNCPVVAAPDGACQQNYTILMTDGFWNGGNPAAGNADNNTGGNNFDGGAFADNFSQTLADVAMDFYKRDLHSLADNVPSTVRDRNLFLGTGSLGSTIHQHMATYTVGFGVTGTIAADPVDPTAAFTWPDPTTGSPQRIDDLRHAAYNGRGQFLSANSPVTLGQALQSIFDEIQAGTGTASSVAFNTQEISSGAVVFRAFFNTDNNTGDLLAHPVKTDGTIDLTTSAWGVDGAGQAITASSQLDGVISSGSRVMVTYDNLATPKAGTEFQFANLNLAQQALLTTQQVAYLRGDSTNEAPAALNFRKRQRKDPAAPGNFLTTKVKLGDIIHSTPVFVGAPPFFNRDNVPFPSVTGSFYSEFKLARKTRTPQVMVGANEGLMHAFNANNGIETFAYVPNEVFANLAALTDPNYNHQFYVDLTPSINDIFINAWQTVLVGGLRGGGNGYFALDITDPTTFASEATAKTKVMWEFTNANDTGGSSGTATAAINDNNLGKTYIRPLIGMSNVDSGGSPTHKKWVAIFGNGYNSTSTDGDAELYIAFIEDGTDGVWTRGTDFVKINTGNGIAEATAANNIPPAFLGVPNSLGGVRGIDVDGNGTVDVIYAGDLQGNLYRFDISSSNTASWDVQKLFTTFHTFSNLRQPITNRPIVIKQPDTNLTGFVVIFGTGSWMTVEDATSNDIQSIYGVWDDYLVSNSPSNAIVPVQNSKLQQQSFTNQGGQTFGGQTFTVRTLSNNTFQWGTNGQKKQGWFIDLDVPCIDTTFCSSIGQVEFPGERAIRNFQLRGDFVFVNTVLPKTSVACGIGPGGFELGFNPKTGGIVSAKQIFDLNNDGKFDEKDNVGGAAGDANIAAGIRFDDATPTDSAFIGNKKTTQTSDTKVRATTTNTDDEPGGGRNSWREVEL